MSLAEGLGVEEKWTGEGRSEPSGQSSPASAAVGLIVEGLGCKGQRLGLETVIIES